MSQHQHHHHHDHRGHAAAHDHGHHHGAAHNTVVEANRSFFDEQAASYDSKHEKLLERLTAELRSRLDFIGVDWADDDGDSEEDGDGGGASRQQDQDAVAAEGEKEEKRQRKQVRMLDYACGTGMMSRALAPYVTQCVGIDLSENMVAAYNARARNQGLAEDEMFAVVGDLASATDPDPPALSGPEFRDFDLAAVGGGFHHFADPTIAAARLVERLRPGGVLLIWDFMPHDDDRDSDAVRKFGGQAAHHTIAHHGFSESGIRDIYEKAAAGKNFELVNLGAGFLSGHGNDEEKEKMRRRVFLSRGEKVGP